MDKSKETGRVGGYLYQALIFLGFIIMLFPSISEVLARLKQQSSMGHYERVVVTQPSDRRKAILERARDFNNDQRGSQIYDAFSDCSLAVDAQYFELLNIDGVMATLSIPSIGVSLPVHHGTTERSLRDGVGHLVGTSLPVGGTDTHAVLTGHRGLADAVLLTNLDKVVLGDYFSISVMGEKLVYQVDQILVVEPSDISQLGVVPGGDYVTLVTCTPYGVNSHRLLVRGVRTEIQPAVFETTANRAWDRRIFVLILPLSLILIHLIFRYQRLRAK